MTRRRASPTSSTLRCNTTSIIKDLIYHIPVVVFQFIILIVLTGGAEFTVWKKDTRHISKLETNNLSFFLMVHYFVLENAGSSNQRDFFLQNSLVLRICRIRVTAKTFPTRANFFLQSSSLFLGAFVSSVVIKS